MGFWPPSVPASLLAPKNSCRRSQGSRPDRPSGGSRSAGGHRRGPQHGLGGHSQWGLTIIDREVTFPPTAKDGESSPGDTKRPEAGEAHPSCARTASNSSWWARVRCPNSAAAGTQPLGAPRIWRDTMGICQPRLAPCLSRWSATKTLISSHPYERPFTSRDRFAIVRLALLVSRVLARARLGLG